MAQFFWDKKSFRGWEVAQGLNTPALQVSEFKFHAYSHHARSWLMFFVLFLSITSNVWPHGSQEFGGDNSKCDHCENCNKKMSKGLKYSSVVEHFSCICKTLGWVPSTSTVSPTQICEHPGQSECDPLTCACVMTSHSSKHTTLNEHCNQVCVKDKSLQQRQQQK